ncbi:mfs allantoate transporter [Diplodia corticola]|uniref:Mfs allantoate transporter n=1 Tax=Diplodia corticola TaxID=236234 RepID=A0A1J9QVT4_9PEZI|nr:mfs allantoate transporter [Diplodia corticola]OJD33102.1 mfs allantoate transporter [Diplodia corticola]
MSSHNSISTHAAGDDGMKSSAAHIEAVGTESLHMRKLKNADTVLTLFSDQDDVHQHCDAAEEGKLIRKIDWMILPYLSVCYVFFYLDKTTLSYAAIFGVSEDIHLDDVEYSWLSSIFYFGFMAWALPTNLLMQRYPIGKYLAINIILWGLLLMAQAAATDFSSLAALRALSGAAEACADPAFMIITVMWYTRREQPIRIGLWYTSLGLGIAGGGLLGYGIGTIRGALPSWKYEFIIVGSLCSAWGIVMFFLLPDSPVSAPLLTMRERKLAVARLRENQTGIESKQFKMYQLVEAVTDLKVLLLFIIALLQALVNGGITNFGTLIVKGFGYTTLGTSLLQIPYGVFISLMILLCVFINNKMPGNKRCLMLLLFLTPNIVAAVGMRFISTQHRVGRLICYYLSGSYNASFVMLLSLTTGNIAGHTKKVVTNACLFTGYCVGNIAGPFFYKTSQAPTYALGIWSMIVSHLLEVVVVGLLWVLLRRENRRRDGLQRPGDSEEELGSTAFADLTDKENLNFRYVY